MIIAAIDIGSNAARLLINKVLRRDNETLFSKLNLLRIPLKLGFDVFKNQTISEEKTEMFIQTMSIFQDLMKLYKVDHYRACATSAMRDASNGKEILKKVKKDLGMEIVSIQVIGSGGNINKVFSLSKTKEGKAVPAHFLKFIHKELEPLSISKRMKRYNLREDRAAVIVPAMQIFQSVLKWGGLDEIFVPKIGLADGIVKKLYFDLSKTS